MKTTQNQQRFKLFIFNVFAFAAIFLVLGLIIINLLQSSAYHQTDQNLTNLSNNRDLTLREINRFKSESSGTVIQQPQQPDDLPKKDQQPNNRFTTQLIFWSKDGKILNKDSLSQRLTDVSKFKLDTTKIDKITNLEISASDTTSPLHFRSITIMLGTADETAGIKYIQIIENTNQIVDSLSNSQMIVLVCLVIFWIISIALSYLLSALNMKPIIASWKKQQTFVENASHELRTPLTIIQNSLQKLFTVPDHTIMEESTSIAAALQETRRLNKLTSDLLTLARSDSNEQVLDIQEIAAAPFIQKISEPFQEMAQLDEKNFTIAKNQAHLVKVDERKLHQVLVIFLDNAMKYTKAHDQIVLKSQFTKNNWEISIMNSGGKISDADKAKIFERFHRVDSSRTKSSGGFGLGLAIAQEIITQHHGTIKVVDWGDNGTNFIISLPQPATGDNKKEL